MLSDFEQAVRERYGAGHYVTAILEEPVSSSFPKGITGWIVEHENADCTHSPRCHWYTVAFVYQKRVTLITESEMVVSSVYDILAKITGAMLN